MTNMYLQGVLVRNAKRVIVRILNHGHLYKAAQTELEEQFGNEELVARGFMNTVLDHLIVAEGEVTQLLHSTTSYTMQSL